MCRLFGISGGYEPVKARFWLLEAPDSLSAQSHREPDGTGIGKFTVDGRPEVLKQPLAAFEDRRFGREARELESRTFVAHVRFASNGGLTLRNTHPFEQRRRIFAHNGVIGDVPALERELGDAMAMVEGDTDSERWFALITREIERTGDVLEGITTAARWLAANLPIFSANFVLITASDLWAFRYPAEHELHVLEREAGGGEEKGEHLEHSGPHGNIHVHSPDLATRPAVIVATERMDDHPDWREMHSGELVHVDDALNVISHRILTEPPAHPLTLADLDPRAAESQKAAKAG
jgi:predicted glutamine amidotransferase